MKKSYFLLMITFLVPGFCLAMIPKQSSNTTTSANSGRISPEGCPCCSAGPLDTRKYSADFLLSLRPSPQIITAENLEIAAKINAIIPSDATKKAVEQK